MSRPRLLLVNKPFHVLTQFTSVDGKASLRDFIDAPDCYPAGRLDYDSEGLVLLTNSGSLQARLAEPRFKVAKTYLVQVDGMPTLDAIAALRNGVLLNDGMTRPADVQRVADEAAGDEAPEVFALRPCLCHLAPEHGQQQRAGQQRHRHEAYEEERPDAERVEHVPHEREVHAPEPDPLPIARRHEMTPPRHDRPVPARRLVE